jgi:enoyl-CoA hydratase
MRAKPTHLYAGTDQTGKGKIESSRVKGVAIVSIDRPPVNSLPGYLMVELEKSIEQLAGDSQIKVIIITGTGKTFASGADINEMACVKSAAEARAISETGQKTYLKIEQCPKPVIAAIHGLCFGGGLELALSCHMRFASDKTIFSMPEIQIGLLSAFGGSYRLPAAIGYGRALQMMLTAQKINSSQALSFGLVNDVFPAESMIDEVRKIALQMCKYSSATMRYILQTALKGRFAEMNETLKAEAEAVGKLYDMNDLKEGVFAWIEKRKPNFKDC